MARYGILADIHGNREALAAALQALEHRGGRARRLPRRRGRLQRRPRRMRAAGAPALRPGDRRQPRPDRRRAAGLPALLQRRRVLAAAHAPRALAGKPRLARLAALQRDPRGRRGAGARRRARRAAVHDHPAHIRENAAFLRADFPGARVCFFGHSHEQRSTASTPTASRSFPPMARFFSGRRTRISSIPARSTPRASAAASSPNARSSTAARGTLEFLRVPYDGAATEAKAAVVRLPPHAPHRPALQPQAQARSPPLRPNSGPGSAIRFSRP